MKWRLRAARLFWPYESIFCFSADTKMDFASAQNLTQMLFGLVNDSSFLATYLAQQAPRVQAQISPEEIVIKFKPTCFLIV